MPKIAMEEMNQFIQEYCVEGRMPSPGAVTRFARRMFRHGRAAEALEAAEVQAEMDAMAEQARRAQ